MKSEGDSASFGIRGILETLTSSDIISGLSNIADIGEMLENSADNLTPEEAGTLIKLQSERMARLIDGLLTVEHINNGLLVPQPTATTLRPTLNQTIKNLEPLSKRYATTLKLGRYRNLRPITVDQDLIITALQNALEGVIRTTASKKIKVDTVSRDDRLFIHIMDIDASYESQEDGASRSKAGTSHAISIPSFYIAHSLLKAMEGEFRITASSKHRHIDLVLPHTVQLNLGL